MRRTRPARRSPNGSAGAQTEGVSSDGESFLIDDTLFTICPWWDGPITRAGIAAQLAEAARQPRKQWIWIHHAPPDKSPTSWGGARYFGDTELAQWIGEYQPDIVFCGHVHQSPFVKDGSWVDRIGDDLGVQCRAAIRRPADAHHHRYR